MEDDEAAGEVGAYAGRVPVGVDGRTRVRIELLDLVNETLEGLAHRRRRGGFTGTSLRRRVRRVQSVRTFNVSRANFKTWTDFLINLDKLTPTPGAEAGAVKLLSAGFKAQRNFLVALRKLVDTCPKPAKP